MSEADMIIKNLKNSGKKVEEFYMSNKTSDKNVGSIEDDVKRCNELIKVEHANWIGISNQLAISHILAEREQMLKAINTVEKEKSDWIKAYQEEKDSQFDLLKRIKELEEEVKMLDEAYTGTIKESKKWFDIAHNSIPTQVVIEALEDIEDYFDRLNGPDEDMDYIRKIKKELLERKK